MMSSPVNIFQTIKHQEVLVGGRQRMGVEEGWGRLSPFLQTGWVGNALHSSRFLNHDNLFFGFHCWSPPLLAAAWSRWAGWSCPDQAPASTSPPPSPVVSSSLEGAALGSSLEGAALDSSLEERNSSRWEGTASSPQTSSHSQVSQGSGWDQGKHWSTTQFLTKKSHHKMWAALVAHCVKLGTIWVTGPNGLYNPVIAWKFPLPSASSALSSRSVRP